MNELRKDRSKEKIGAGTSWKGCKWEGREKRI